MTLTTVLPSRRRSIPDPLGDVCVGDLVVVPASSLGASDPKG
jgi:hypothetical protein